ncbi:MAG TPA: DUF4339 domain-containing protein [Pirellulales bacterium]|nr:DUF4339 domain-containing protein [Pirellulales bacterium]
MKSELAGKRGRCPQCQEKIEIPTESAPGGTGTVTLPTATAPTSTAPTSTAPAASAAPASGPADPAAAPQAVPFAPGHQATGSQPAAESYPAAQPAMAAPAGVPGGAPLDPISEAPQLQWYVMPPGATSQYGPAVGEEFRGWIREGRVAADTLVWRQDWPEWKPAGLVFPELQPAPAAQPGAAQAGAAAPMAAPLAPAGYAIPTAAGALPTATGAAPMLFPGDASGMPAPGGFPGAPSSPTASARRGRYRKRSNTGPMIAIIVLVVAMIPLSYFVWRVIERQILAQPAPTASPAAPAE